MKITDLISRSAVLDIINEERRFSESLREIIEYNEDRAHNAGELSCAIQLERKVKKIPAIDAVPVVRCKDCKHWRPCAGATEHVKCCEFAGYMVGANGYCVYGEKSE